MPLRDQTENVGRIIREGLLHPVFQPILDFRAHAYLGFEALIRGPASSPLHYPAQLFAAARSAGLASALEHACREASLRAFARLGLPGRLFLNMTPGCLLDERLMNGETCRLLKDLGIAANRVVIELTENQQITDLPGIHEGLQHFRGRGFQVAIDDLGDGSGGYMAENRKGELVFQALPTLSVGAVRIHPRDCDSHREIAAAVSAAKKEAKKADRNLPGKPRGGCVFVERRRSCQVEDARLAGSRLKSCSEPALGQLHDSETTRH